MPRNLVRESANVSIQGERLVKLLGYSPGTKLLIITCDEFGESHASNIAIIRAMEEGLGIRKYVIGATIQMPSPWSREAIDYVCSHPGVDIGVHLTVCTTPSWRPLSSKKEVPGLYSPQGYFWKSAKEMWIHSTEEEIYKECRAQIEMAFKLGLDITHIDTHEAFQPVNYAGCCRVCGALTKEFRLPLRLEPRWKFEEKGAGKFRDKVLGKGTIVCDDDTGISQKSRSESFKEFYLRRLRELVPNSLTDLYIHPIINLEEMKSLNRREIQGRVEQYHMLVHDPDFWKAIKQPEMHIINWRDVRDLQRKMYRDSNDQ